MPSRDLVPSVQKSSRRDDAFTILQSFCRDDAFTILYKYIDFIPLPVRRWAFLGRKTTSTEKILPF